MIREGRPMDFFAIYDQYYLQVRRFILSLVRDEWVADDLAQETFIRIRQNLGSLKDSSKISSWVMRIAHNLCLDYFRDRKKSSNERELNEETDGFKESFIQKVLEQDEMGKCVKDVVNLLPESLRSVIVLFDAMEFSHQEIADTLGISVQNVKVRLHRARKKLKALLEEKCTFEVDERSVLTCEPVKAGVGKVRTPL